MAENDDDEDFAELPAAGRLPSGRKRSLPPSSNGLQQNEVTTRRICELGRQSLTHQQISAMLHAEGLLNSKGARWARTTDGKVIERVLHRNAIPLVVAPSPAGCCAPAAVGSAMAANGGEPPRSARPRADGAGGGSECGTRGPDVAASAGPADAPSSPRHPDALPPCGTAGARTPVATRPQLQAAVCLLCAAPFAATGRHQPCSLACGHIFGRSCISTHLFRRKACSLCGASARRASVRPIYATAQLAQQHTDGHAPVASRWELETRREEALSECIELELARLQAELHELQQRALQLRTAAILRTPCAAAPLASLAVGRRDALGPASHGQHWAALPSPPPPPPATVVCAGETGDS